MKKYTDQNNNLLKLISKYVKLEEINGNYKGSCPFHEETTPSFVVSIEKDMFHYFGCESSGNAQEFERLIAIKENNV